LREAELFLAGDVHDLNCARIELALCYVRIAYDPNSINPHQSEDLSATRRLVLAKFLGRATIRDLW